MPLTAGSRLGPYEILSLLGSGGMGEVYRALDPRLDREVAIKVLPPERMDEERRRRFVLEARAASALNHPNIVTIHEIEYAEGRDFIVMEYVAGKSLDRLIPRQGMPLGEVLRIATPVADALARAHGRGIVHRDLKPANVIVGSEGAVKLLDFGLAKLVASPATSPEAETETAERPLTRAGAVSGTVGYMSPEQASGREVDARTDIFSFGALLYEMVAGRRAFAGDSAAATLAAVMREQPKAPSEVAPDVPRDLERVILRCLRKESDRRYQSMADVKLELEQIKEDSGSQPRAGVAPGPRRRHRRRDRRRSRRDPCSVWQRPGSFCAPALPASRLRSSCRSRRSTADEWSPTFSPDGEQVAFSWNGEKWDDASIYVKMIGSAEVRRLTTDPASDGYPAWSPDGRQIAFVRTVGEDTGRPGRPPDDPLGLARWRAGPSAERFSRRRAGSRGRLTASGWRQSMPALPARASLKPVASTSFPFPVASPVSSRGSRRPATTRARPSPRTGATWRMHRAPAAPTAGVTSTSSISARTSRPPALRVASPITASASALSPGRATGPRSSIAPPRRPTSSTSGGWPCGAIGRRSGSSSRATGRGRRAVARSRDRLAFSEALREVDIHRFLSGRPSEALLASSFFEGHPRFSPDGGRIAFASTRSGDRMEIWLAAADGSSPAQLTRGPGRLQNSPAWFPDGQRIAFDSLGEDGRSDIWTIDVAGGAPRRLTRDPGDESMPSFSRDGRWVYFYSERDGAGQIWRVPAGAASRNS